MNAKDLFDILLENDGNAVAAKEIDAASSAYSEKLGYKSGDEADAGLTEYTLDVHRIAFAAGVAFAFDMKNGKSTATVGSESSSLTWEKLEEKQSELVCDIRADLEGVSAMAEALHTLACGAMEDGKMDPYYCSAIYGLWRAIDNLDADINRRQDALCKERLPLVQGVLK